MPVQLDWEIDDGEAPVESVGRIEVKKRSRLRRWWLMFVLLAVAIIVASGFVGLRIRQRKKESESELHAVVELELKALINGDQDLFLNRQNPNDRRWRRAQEEVFETYHPRTIQNPWDNIPQDPEYTGQIPVVQVDGDGAWAQIEITSADRAWREIWFYHWTQEDGWRHVRFDEDWLGEEQQLTTLHLDFTYPERDADIVESLAHEMENWYEELVRVFGIRDTNKTLLTIHFAFRDPTRLRWAETHWTRRSFALQAPSPHQVHLSVDDLPTAELRQQMAGYLAEALIGQQIGVHPDETLGPVLNALRHELRDWSVAHIADSVSHGSTWTPFPAPLVDALIAREGFEILPPLVESLHRTGSLDQVLATASLDPPDPMTRFAFQLAALNRTFYSSDLIGYQALIDPRADRAWRQYHLNQIDLRRESAQADQIWPGPPSFQIESVTFNSPIAWVEVETKMDDGITYRQALFFRQTDDRWLLTSPDPTYFGERQMIRTKNLIFHHYAREAEWFEGQIPAKLQAVFSQAATDLGIATDRLVITVETELQPGINGWTSEAGRRIRFTSPLVEGWPVDQPDDQVLQMAMPLLGAMFENLVQFLDEEDNRMLVTYITAFLWELERLFPERIDPETLLGIDSHQVPTTSLTDLWAKPTLESVEGEIEPVLVDYRALLQFLVETYGLGVVPALLDNLSQTDDLDEWLLRSSGHGLDEIEPAWRAWLLTRYGE